MASTPPRRTLPSGETMIASDTSTKMFPDSRKNQSKLPVRLSRSAGKKLAAWSGSARVRTTNRMISPPEITKTGLWISSPNGPILG